MTSYNIEKKAIKCMIGEYFLQCDGKKTAHTNTKTTSTKQDIYSLSDSVQQECI